jgi:putative transposase
LSVRRACAFIGISRQAFYQWKARESAKAARDQDVLCWVDAERRLQPQIGTRKLKHVLAEQGIGIGRDALFALLRQNRRLVRPRRAYHKTTQSHHRFWKHPKP